MEIALLLLMDYFAFVQNKINSIFELIFSINLSSNIFIFIHLFGKNINPYFRIISYKIHSSFVACNIHKVKCKRFASVSMDNNIWPYQWVILLSYDRSNYVRSLWDRIRMRKAACKAHAALREAMSCVLAAWSLCIGSTSSI